MNNNDPIYAIVEIFQSLQGEGSNTGMPAIFIRFGKCNLACVWCDTDYKHFKKMPLSEIMQKVRSFSAKNIIITGGEPSIQPQIDKLLIALKAENYFIAIESNGLKPIPQAIDYIAVSPKCYYWNKYRQECISKADEVRIVVDEGEDIFAFCEFIEQKINAKYYYLSPCEIRLQMNLLETITLLGRLNQRQSKLKWQLSIQSHKLIGIE